MKLDDVIYLDDNQWDHEEDRRNRWLSHYLAAGCNGSKWIGPFLPNQPAELAKSLYANVVAHPTAGIPSGEDWKVFEPYLSQSLLHRIDIYDACIADEERQYSAYKGPPLKLLSLDEFGIFSGSDEEEAPRTFFIERAESRKDGVVRVYVRLTLPPDKTDLKEMEWRVADDFIQEHGRYVLRDVIFPDEVFFNGEKLNRVREPDEYLSRNLVGFCNGGTHWKHHL